MDLYNGEIIAYNLATRPLPSMVKAMLTDALKVLAEGKHPLLHSDQGWSYQMPRWQRWLKDNGIIQSMSRCGNCLDNAAIESFFGTLKSECYYLNEYNNVDDLRRDIIGYIDYYNQLRIKEKLGGLSPVQYRLKQVECPRSGRHFLSSRRGLFEGLETDASEMTVAPGPVVEHFNVIEDIRPGHVPGFIYSLSDTFFFE